MDENLKRKNNIIIFFFFIKDNKEEKFYTHFTEENLRKFEKNLDFLNKTDTSREKSAKFLNNEIRKERVDRYLKLEQDTNDLELHG